MIPKIIHYCWFGKNPKSSFIKNCISSWEKILKDYQIIEWNEENFDIKINKYVEQAYDMKKWAFVSDYARLWALYNYGGIYLDTDVEVLKSLDEFLTDLAFTGYESSDCPITAVFGAEKHNNLIKQLMAQYDNRLFIKENGEMDLTTNTIQITEFLLSNGIKPNGKLQVIDGLKIYPQIYFCPNNFLRIWNIPSSKSFTIHHFDSSWRNEKKHSKTLSYRVRRYLVGVLRNTIGTKKLEKIKSSWAKK